MKYPRLFRDGQSYKLTEEEKVEIKKLYSSGDFSRSKLAWKFNVSETCIRYWTDEKMKARVNKYSKNRRKYLLVSEELQRQRKQKRKKWQMRKKEMQKWNNDKTTIQRKIANELKEKYPDIYESILKAILED